MVDRASGEDLYHQVGGAKDPFVLHNAHLLPGHKEDVRLVGLFLFQFYRRVRTQHLSQVTVFNVSGQKREKEPKEPFVDHKRWRMYDHHSVNQFCFLAFGRTAKELLGGHPLGHFNASQHAHGNTSTLTLFWQHGGLSKL